MLRSDVGDPAWRAALAKRDPDALAAFKRHEPAARRFLAERKWMRTPPWHEAKLFLAAGDAKLDQPGVDEVLGEYAGSRGVWEVGKPPAAGGSRAIASSLAEEFQQVVVVPAGVGALALHAGRDASVTREQVRRDAARPRVVGRGVARADPPPHPR